MRRQAAGHPDPVRDWSRVFDSGSGRTIRSDAKGAIAGYGRQRNNQAAHALYNLRRKQMGNSWRTHQSVACAKRGKCAYNGCPNLLRSKAKYPRSYDTHMRCEECSLMAGKDVYFCNDVKKGVPCLCHLAYHTHHCS